MNQGRVIRDNVSVDKAEIGYTHNGAIANGSKVGLEHNHNGIVANGSDELYISFRLQVGAMVLQGAVGQALSIKPIYDDVIQIIGDTIRDERFISYFDTIYRYDKSTFKHSIRVAIYALILSNRLKLTDDEKRKVVIASLLHDIGKINIAHNILNKPSKLNDDEMRTIQNHTVYGYDILKDDANIEDDILFAIKHHHERYDGTGYPDKLKDKDTHIFAKIISVSDIYDAITSRRSYKNGRKLLYSIRYLESISNTAICSEIVDNFIESIGVFTVGTTLMLDSNEIAVIFQNNNDNSFMPTVQIITDSYCKLIDNPFYFDMNKKDANGRYLKSIKSIVRKELLFQSLIKK